MDVAALKPGQKLFIQAGSGGVGTFAIQLARHLGATIATTVSAANANLVKGLGADVVIDYKTQDFAKILSGYDVVLNSQDGRTLEKSLGVLGPGGRLVSISGPPDPQFARKQGLNLGLRLLFRLLSRGIRSRAKRRGVDYSFLFMWAEGEQLGKIAALIELGRSARWWTGFSPSRARARLWPMSNSAGQGQGRRQAALRGRSIRPSCQSPGAWPR